jgi:DNA-directed RNA polymerase subunit RPC12/RpoP
VGALDDILQPIPEEPTGPEFDMCKCSTCGKTFKVSEIISEVESENWENPQTYLVHYCPHCEDGGELLEYWPSKESLAKWKKEQSDEAGTK